MFLLKTIPNFPVIVSSPYKHHLNNVRNSGHSWPTNTENGSTSVSFDQTSSIESRRISQTHRKALKNNNSFSSVSQFIYFLFINLHLCVCIYWVHLLLIVSSYFPFSYQITYPVVLSNRVCQKGINNFQSFIQLC